MKFLKYILFSALLFCNSLSYSQNNLIKVGNNLIKVGNNLLTWSYNVDAQVFFDTIEARGGSLTVTEKGAISTYVGNLKGSGVWTLISAGYPMVGGTAISCAVNLKNPGTFDITWVNTIASDFTANGWTPNGSTSFGITNHPPTNFLFLEYYSRTNSNSLTQIADIGCQNNGRRNILRSRISGFTRFDCLSSGLGRVEAVVANSLGSFVGSRVSDTDSRVYQNGVQTGAIITNAGLVPTFGIYIGCNNLRDVAGEFSLRQCAGASIGIGMTPAKVLAQYNARQQMNTTLGRQINP